MGPAALVVLTLASLALGLTLRGQMRTSAARLFRTLVPSWRFFAEIDPVPVLEYRVDQGPWREALPPLPRGPSSLLSNGAGNLRLAEHGVVEALLDELDGLAASEAPALVSYLMVRAMIGERLRERGEQGSYQFRLIASDGASPDEEVFRSEVHASS